MREILFRGKNCLGEWVYGFFWENVYGNYFIRESIMDTGTIYHDVEVDPNTIGQCTGLTDKYGRQIFEGDIVKLKHKGYYDSDKIANRKSPCYSYDCSETHLTTPWATDICCEFYRNYVVEYFSGSSMSGYRIRHKTVFKDLSARFTISHEMEVIGNIHDNPELME